MSRHPEAERDRVAPAWTINPVRGIVIGLIVIAVISGLLFFELRDEIPQRSKLPWKLYAVNPSGVLIEFDESHCGSPPHVGYQRHGHNFEINVNVGPATPGCKGGGHTVRHVDVGLPGYRACSSQLTDGATGRVPPAANPHRPSSFTSCDPFS